MKRIFMGIFNLTNVPPPDDRESSDSDSGADQSASLDTSALTETKNKTDDKEVVPLTVEKDPVKTLEFTPQIVDQLATVFDPEIPVNIYELGLIYDIIVDSNSVAMVQMTLTAPNCPAAITLPAEVQGKVKAIEGIADAHIDLVWEPPWSKERMTEAARLQLGIFD